MLMNLKGWALFSKFHEDRFVSIQLGLYLLNMELTLKERFLEERRICFGLRILRESSMTERILTTGDTM